MIDTITFFLISSLILGVLYYFSASKSNRYMLGAIFFIMVFFLAVMVLAGLPVYSDTTSTVITNIDSNYYVTETNNLAPLDLTNPLVNFFAWMGTAVGFIGAGSCVLKAGLKK